MNSDKSDHCQEDELYNEDEEDQDLYTPSSGADFRVNIGASTNSRIITPASNTIVNNLANPQKMEEMDNSTPSTSNRHQINVNSTANDQNTAIARHWTDEWEAENARNQEETHRSNNDLEAEIESMQKKMQQLEEVVAEFQGRFEQNQLRNKTTSRNAVKSEIEIIQIDDDDEETEIKQECGQSNNDSSAENKKLQNEVQQLKDIVVELQKQLTQLQFEKDQLCNNTTSQDVVLEVARPEPAQSHNAAAVDLTSPEIGPADDHALTDCQPSLTPFINHQPDISKEPTEEREVSPNVDLSISLNMYPGAISSSITENECEANTTGRFHGIIGEPHYSDDAHITALAQDQVIDNGSPQSSEQNESQTAVDLNASGVMTAISVRIPAEIPRLKCSKGPNKRTKSSASNPPTVSSEPLQSEEMPRRLRLRGRKQIHHWGSDLDNGHDLPAKRKRSRLLRTDQNFLQSLEGNSIATSIVDDQNPQHLGESSGKRATNDHESEYARESESNTETITCTSRTGSKIKEKRYKCGVCSYSTNNSGNLPIHRRIHTGEKPFKCTQCSYESARAEHLENHMRTHTGEKPYKCRQCAYACALLGNLKMHMRTHTGEKPYKCSLCSFASAQSGDLKTHIRTHTGEKPFKCDRCSYACAQVSNLKSHMRTHVRKNGTVAKTNCFLRS